MTRNLKSVADFANGSPFSESQIRWWLYNANSNGLDGAKAVVRIGRRIYLDVDGFERWLDAQNDKARAA